jgi:hypothetical protein
MMADHDHDDKAAKSNVVVIIDDVNKLLRKRAHLEESRNEMRALKGAAVLVHRELTEASKRVKPMMMLTHFQSLVSDFDALIEKSKGIIDAHDDKLCATELQYQAVFDESQMRVAELRSGVEVMEVLQFVPFAPQDTEV